MFAILNKVIGWESQQHFMCSERVTALFIYKLSFFTNIKNYYFGFLVIEKIACFEVNETIKPYKLKLDILHLFTI